MSSILTNKLSSDLLHHIEIISSIMFLELVPTQKGTCHTPFFQPQTEIKTPPYTEQRTVKISLPTELEDLEMSDILFKIVSLPKFLKS